MWIFFNWGQINLQICYQGNCTIIHGICQRLCSMPYGKTGASVLVFHGVKKKNNSLRFLLV